jgi:3-phenylpropionate/cinnamic acid dioxygenase small subunit
MLVECGMPLTDAARRDVEEFLCHETALLDGRRFQEWPSLFTADALYWIPNGGGGDPTVDRSIVYDDYTRQPPLRTQCLVSNVVARQAEDGAVRVTSSQVV